MGGLPAGLDDLGGFGGSADFDWNWSWFGLGLLDEDWLLVVEGLEVLLCGRVDAACANWSTGWDGRGLPDESWSSSKDLRWLRRRSWLGLCIMGLALTLAMEVMRLYWCRTLDLRLVVQELVLVVGL